MMPYPPGGVAALLLTGKCLAEGAGGKATAVIVKKLWVIAKKLRHHSHSLVNSNPRGTRFPTCDRVFFHHVNDSRYIARAIDTFRRR